MCSTTPDPTQRGAPLIGAPLTKGTKHVLVVDDEQALQALFAQVLANAGFCVDVAADGREALSKIAAHPPDLVLLDIMMPVMDGWEVLAQLGRTPDHPPVIVLSAYPNVERAAGAGAVACLGKPFSLSVLVATCHEAVAART
jgi:two-component system, OmpR family, response regulator